MPGFPRVCRPPELISTRCFGRTCRFRITAIPDRNQRWPRMAPVRAAELEQEMGPVLAQARITESALVGGATQAVVTKAPVAAALADQMTTTRSTSFEFIGCRTLTCERACFRS